ncbi:hypothetical protein COK39_24560 [Priestia megaterium]|nr:hypothetical protein COK39_24560 [Priestia megaterium]
MFCQILLGFNTEILKKHKGEMKNNDVIEKKSPKAVLKTGNRTYLRKRLRCIFLCVMQRWTFA